MLGKFENKTADPCIQQCLTLELLGQFHGVNMKKDQILLPKPMVQPLTMSEYPIKCYDQNIGKLEIQTSDLCI